MKRAIICLFLLLSLVLSACQTSDNNTSDNNTQTDDPVIVSSTISTDIESFTEHKIEITATYVGLFAEPSYEAELIGAIYKQGTYVVIEETTEVIGDTLLHWGKLNAPEGWIVLDYINDDYPNTEDYIGSTEWTYNQREGNEFSSVSNQIEENELSEIYSQQESSFEPYQIKIQNNKVVVHTVPGSLLSNQLYEITDRRTITIVEEAEIMFGTSYRTWGRLDTGGWVWLTEAYYVEDENATTPSTTTPSTTTPSTTAPSTTAPSTTAPSTTAPSTTEPSITTPSTPSTPTPTPILTPTPTPTPDSENQKNNSENEDKPKITSVTVHNITFNYVSSYYYKATYSGEIIDYNINLAVKYCEPSEYMSDNDRIIAIHNSSGTYMKEQIGSLYKSAGYDDFAVFEVTISGKYTDEFFGHNNIEYRQYAPGRVLLRDLATKKTEYEILSLNQTTGTLNEKIYIGFYTSEVASVDFMICEVSPNGIGW